MALEPDHVFVCCAPGAPEGDALVRLGLREGSGNTHPGQGTACRRFFFADAYLELLWLADPVEAAREPARSTRLAERCMRRGGVSPFGIVFRPRGDEAADAPFATWSYRPAYLPAGFSIEMAVDTPLTEPELIVLPFARRSGAPPREPVEHAVPIGALRGIHAGGPAGHALSAPARQASAAGLLVYETSPDPHLELVFEAATPFVLDLRPTLPVVLRGPARA